MSKKTLFQNDVKISEKINRYENKSKAMQNNSKSITWSKILLIITGIIFIAVISVSFGCLIIMKENMYDTAIFVTSITVSGSIFGSNLCWYSKKSTSENHYKLRLSMYEDIINDRLYFNEEMMKLKKKYGTSEEDISDIDDSGEIDELMNDEFSNMHGKMDEDRDLAESEDQIENF